MKVLPAPLSPTSNNRLHGFLLEEEYIIQHTKSGLKTF
jgi:hypothetical protein